MVVVVPAFAHGQQAEHPVVPAIVIHFISPLPDHVRNGINAEGHVVDGDRAKEKTVKDKLPARNAPVRFKPMQQRTNPQQHPGKYESRCIGMSVEPHQFGVFGKILYAPQVGFHQLPLHDPSNMRLPEAPVPRGMHIVFLVGIHVVEAVVARPPERVALGCGGPKHGQDKLEHTAGLEALVGKIPVVARGQGKNMQLIREAKDRPSRPSARNKKKIPAQQTCMNSRGMLKDEPRSAALESVVVMDCF